MNRQSSGIPTRFAVFILVALLLVTGARAQRFGGSVQQSLSPPDEEASGEFQFARMIYTDNARNRRGRSGWWSQDWPDAEQHFFLGVSRLTRLEIGDPVTIQLTDERLFDFPWLYATQVGYWDLSDEELDALREYLLRGGFFMTDDFFGDNEWNVFEDTMRRLFPDRPMVHIPRDDPILHSVYNIDDFTQIPGLRHIGCGGGFGRRGGGFGTTSLPAPEWLGIYDDNERLIVAINYNQDVGDAWEEADDPCYPQPMTALAYRIAINYVTYAMTH
jgi:hypothetical protein